MPELPAGERADALLDLMGYLYPRRKAVEHIGEGLQSRIDVQIASNGREKSETGDPEIRKLRIIRQVKNLLQVDKEFAKAIFDFVADPQMDHWKKQIEMEYNADPQKFLKESR